MSISLRIKSPDGVSRAELVGVADGGFVRLAAAMEVNAAGVQTFDLLSNNAVIADLQDDSQIELWRDEAMLFRTLYQSPAQYKVDDKDRVIFTATCYGEVDLLNRMIIAWPEGTINRTVFADLPAETIMYTLVRYNATTDATETNGRLVSFPSPRITVEADRGRGNIISRSEIAGKPLLQELQEIAAIGGIDFDLIQVAPRQWMFRVFPGQRGKDLSASVVFSRERHNIGQLSYNDQLQDPRSVIIVGGNGEGKSREYVVRYGPDYSTANHREYFLPLTGETASTSALQAAGDDTAQEKRIRTSFTFQPLQTGNTRFGVDYQLGDLVRAEYRDVSAVFKVQSVSIGFEIGQQEDIAVEMQQQ